MMRPPIRTFPGKCAKGIPVTWDERFRSRTFPGKCEQNWPGAGAESGVVLEVC